MNLKKLLVSQLAIAVFCISKAQTIEDLSNKFWRLKSATIAGQVYDFSNSINLAPTMQFSGGTIRGNGGCNAYHTSYTLNKGSIEFGDIKSTKMKCNNLKLDEALYFSTLTNLHQSSYDEQNLVLTSTGGDVLVFYSQFAKPEIYTKPVKEKLEVSDDDRHHVSRRAKLSRHSKSKNSETKKEKKEKKGKKGNKEDDKVTEKKGKKIKEKESKKDSKTTKKESKTKKSTEKIETEKKSSKKVTENKSKKETENKSTKKDPKKEKKKK